MPDAGKHHGDTVLVRRINNFLIDLGTIAEPRALTYTANKLNKPCIAMLGYSAQAEKYRDVRCYDTTGQRLETVVSSVINSLKELIG